MNTRKILMSSALGIAATGVLASVALASPGGGPGGGGNDRRADIAGRIAEIIGVDPADLQAAMTQARSDVRDEEWEARIEAMAANGTLTGAEAAAIQEWLAARPGALDSVDGKMTHRGLFGPAGRGQFHGVDDPSEQLARLVEAERITQEDADEIIAWLDTRPEAMDSLRADRSQEHDARGPRDGRQHGPRQRKMHGRGGPGFHAPGPMNPSDGDAVQNGMPGWLQMIDPPAEIAAY